MNKKTKLRWKNQTPFEKKKTNQTPILLKNPFAKNTLKKTKNMERKPLFKENLYLEKKNFWKKTLNFNQNPLFEENPPI